GLLLVDRRRNLVDPEVFDVWKQLPDGSTLHLIVGHADQLRPSRIDVQVPPVAGRAICVTNELTEDEAIVKPFKNTAPELFTLSQREFRIAARGNIREQYGDDLLLGADGRGMNFKPATQRHSVMFEAYGLASVSHVAVDVVPVLVLIGNHVPNPSAFGVHQTGMLLENAIGFDEPVITRTPILIEFHFDDAKAGFDGIQQLSVLSSRDGQIGR